ncbi:hypothetical protein I302_107308 [Kwoniella bestiolae CBS 10118]|uniref:Uncharacterized protein n=1 Tax=Kwoniella bestiolae CBS 10118 TaxID=1296100 RepID=A0A1B9FYY8_9TREE|nr:hypothetical protein I302_06956 [Kwoniella bestiolae CBS 10118]OCF23970.1 hypothetical protein I302_06956 [Kwoniella bestiolae CBS 10118]
MWAKNFMSILALLGSTFTSISAAEGKYPLQVLLTFNEDTAMNDDPSAYDATWSHRIDFTEQEIADKVEKDFRFVIYKSEDHVTMKADTACEVIAKAPTETVVEWVFNDTSPFLSRPGVDTIYSDFARIHCPHKEKWAVWQGDELAEIDTSSYLAVPSAAREECPALQVGLTFVGDTAMASYPSNINTLLERDIVFSPEEVTEHEPK